MKGYLLPEDFFVPPDDVKHLRCWSLRHKLGPSAVVTEFLGEETEDDKESLRLFEAEEYLIILF